MFAGKADKFEHRWAERLGELAPTPAEGGSSILLEEVFS